MLTPNQEGYLNTVPEGGSVKISPFDPATQIAAREIISEINVVLPSTQIFYIGSSKLGIAGENDIDIAVIANGQFNEYLETIKKLYGQPRHENLDSKYIKWEFVKNSFPVELHLNDVITPNLQEQLDTQRLLEENEDFRKEYEQMKLGSNGLSEREYLKRKYEFWNLILGV